MSRSFGVLIGCVLASAFVAGLTSSAQAYSTPKKHHHVVWSHVAAHRAGDIYVSKNTRSYLDPGTSANEGSEDLYFEDTRYPHYLLGPGIFQRFLTTDGQYN